MRVAAAALAAVLVQTAPTNLPPPYPRAGVTRLFDNDRVQVWNIAWPKGQPSPLHRHVYDLVGVYYQPGDRLITSPEGTKRPVSTKAWDIAFQRTGLTHIEEGTSEAPLRAVFVEMKLAGPYGTAVIGEAPAFSGEGATRKLDNDRVTAWEYTARPAAKPHRHAHDAVEVAFGGAPTVTWVPQGTSHRSEDWGNATRLYLFEIK